MTPGPIIFQKTSSTRSSPSTNLIYSEHQGMKMNVWASLRKVWRSLSLCTLLRRSSGNRLPDPLFFKHFWQLLYLNPQQYKQKIGERCLSEVSILIAEKMVASPWQEGICKNYKKRNEKPDLETLTPQQLLKIIKYSWTNGPQNVWVQRDTQ